MAAPEATIYTRGLSNPAPAISYTISDDLAYAGYLVHVTTTAGSFDATDAVTELPVGYTIKSTVPATMQAGVAGGTDGTALANQFIGVQALIPGQEAYLMLGATIAVTVGDYLGPSSEEGVLAPRTSSGTLPSAAVICCQALESKGPTATAATVGSIIKVTIIAPMYLAAGACPT